jgi:hypothetical protein
MAQPLSDDVDQFRRLCRECWPLPEPPAASRRFDELYGPMIDEWVDRLAADASAERRHWLRVVIRRQTMYYGKDQDWTPAKTISRVGAEVYLAWRDPGWRPG